MTKVLILGANGRIARIVEQRLLAETDVQLTLVLRNARSLSTILTVVIVSGCVISMAANGQRRWWQHNLSFLGTHAA
ncbi:hypothetical protein WP50_21890, partial [Lactiplantibacillus plantarum]